LFNFKIKMPTKYKATTTKEAYFITITTVGCVDVFKRPNQKYNIINFLKYCQENKGLEIYGYCIMSPDILRVEENGCWNILAKYANI
jgi:REP element-mobilizing transposase RayT